VLDLRYLDRLEAHLGPDVLRELMADGLIELTDRVAGMTRMSAAGDRVGVLRHGHDVAGIAGHLGLTALSVAAAAVARAGRQDPTATAAALAAPVLAQAAPACAALRAHILRTMPDLLE
jgi:HPt (histidine-containing phosphotransfer) domain-containing protein